MNEFEKSIKEYLDNYSENDSIFKEKYNTSKIGECCKYIISKVQKLNRKGFTDDEVYHLAREYFDEGLPKVENINCKVVVNKLVDLTEEEKEQAKKAALKEIKNQEEQKIILAEKKKKEQEEKKKQKRLEEEKKKQVEGQLDIFSLLN